MIINVSEGYDKCFIEVSEKPVNNGFYLLKVFDDNEPAISIEL